ncbi:galectin-4-like [Rhinatrema bivittatum]|uniref:galectin-4-like n=1 Tax=Rhinatrema bivittatum TaxID=194408 RepID=UPI00112D478D|nr:galectin-4-like [Rhinatrema bivittatum]
MAFVPAPGYDPAYDPPVPYITAIPGGLRPGMLFYIRGTLAKGYTRFRVDYATGQYEGSDIALHFNPRFDGRDRVIFNTFQNGAWGEEEKKKDTPFSSSRPFELVVQITQANYQITVDGKPYHEYSHHIPMDRVTWLNVKGDIVLQAASIIGCGVGSAGSKGGAVGIPGGLPPMVGPVCNRPAIPFTANIPGGMIPKRTLVVAGHISSGAKSFIINLKKYSSNDIPLHINSRMIKNVLIRNTFLNGVWGEEEKDIQNNPLQKGQFFDLSIRSGDQNFKVYVNGHCLFRFDNRIKNVQEIDTVEIQGDAELAYVFF